MGSHELESIIRPVEVVTKGGDFKLKKYDYRESYEIHGASEISKILRQIFDTHSARQITCWSDVLNSTAPDDHYLFIPKGYFVGVFYKNTEGRDIPTHLFVRQLKNYHGPLDKWKDDIRFPSSTRKYSICAVFPSDWTMPERALHDPHVHGVTQFKVSDFFDIGIRFDEFLDYMLDG